MRRKVIILCLMSWFAVLLAGGISGLFEGNYRRSQQSISRQGIEQIKKLIHRKQYDAALQLCHSEQATGRSEIARLYLLYLEWLSVRSLGRDKEAANIEAEFVHLFRNSPLVAEMYRGDAIHSFEENKFERGIDQLRELVVRFPNSAAADQARQTLVDLKATQNP